MFAIVILLYGCLPLLTLFTDDCRCYPCLRMFAIVILVYGCYPCLRMFAVVIFVYGCFPLLSLFTDVSRCYPCLWMFAIVTLVYECLPLSCYTRPASIIKYKAVSCLGFILKIVRKNILDLGSRIISNG